MILQLVMLIAKLPVMRLSLLSRSVFATVRNCCVVHDLCDQMRKSEEEMHGLRYDNEKLKEKLRRLQVGCIIFDGILTQL